MKNIIYRPFGIIFWIHLLFILTAASSPFWLDWKLIFLAFIALNIQWFMLGGCFLTFLETGKEKGMTFEYYYLSRIWPDLDKRKVKVVSFYILPGLLMIITYVVQIWLGWKPLVRF